MAEQTMKLRIQRDIPPPPIKERNRYPIKYMKVGDSFLIPKDRVPRGPIHGLGLRYGMRLSWKKQENGSVRVWRIA